MKDILMGNEAVALGLIENGCNVISAYPGTPSSEVLPYADKLRKKFNLPIFVEWSVNEKAAFEIAYANAIIGGKSAVIMKQVGLNVAMDSLMSAAYIGHKGSMVVVVADDPGPVSSQTEQDSRFASMFAKLPVFDPSSPEEARFFTKLALELSEKYEIPVILRLTGRISHWKTDIEFDKINRAIFNQNLNFEKNPLRWAAIPKFRHLQHIELNKKLKQISATDYWNIEKISNNTKKLVITSGCCFSHIKEFFNMFSIKDIDILKINMPFPISANISKTILNYDKILIIEESYPVIEYQIREHKVYGRLTGDIPLEGELTIEKIGNILIDFFNIKKDKITTVTSNPKKPELCAGCPHRNSFYAIKKAFPNGIYPSDIGCYTLGLNMGAVDTCLCMGATINQAAGFYHGYKSSGQEIPPIIATIGDSTFYHSGVPALINAVYQKAAFVLVILDNSIVAMTGFQPTPESGVLSNGTGNAVPIDRVVLGCGIDYLKILDPINIEKMIETIKDAWDYSLKNEKVSVIIAKHPCAILARKEGKLKEVKVNINKELCNGCKSCIRDFQCPAIIFDEETKKAEIDYTICVGCGVCVKICKFGAIEIVKSKP